MSNLRPGKTKKFIVTMSDNTSIPIIATTELKALKRVQAWLEKKESSAKIIAIGEITYT